MSTASTFVPTHSESEIADEFLPLLPSIRKSALFAFRRRRFEERSEAVTEVIASAYAPRAIVNSCVPGNLIKRRFPERCPWLVS